MMIGTVENSRMRWQTVKPSILGIITSSSTRSGACASTCSSASTPSIVGRTSYPSNSRLRVTRRRSCGSSSAATIVVFLAGIIHTPLRSSRSYERCYTLFCSVHRKPHMEHTSSGRTALGPDQAIVELDDVLANREPQTKTIDLPCQSCIDPVKAIEDPLKVFRGNAQPIIADTDFHHLPQLLPCRLNTSTLIMSNVVF